MKVFLVDSSDFEEAYADFLKNSEINNLWQSSVWGNFRTTLNKNVLRFLIFDTRKREKINLPGKVVATAQVIETKLPLKKKWWYLPRGPIWEDDEACRNLLTELVQRAKQIGVVYIVLDPLISLPADIESWPTESHQPTDTIVINLMQSEEEILMQMKQKGRYNIRLAKKRGVTIKESKSVDNFYELLDKTTERDGFSGWDKNYYKNMLKTLGENAVLLEAEHEGDTLAAGIFVFYEKTAIYYYGASSNKKRNLMAPYLLQWEAILEGQKRGCTEYDFLGVAPEGEKNHPWSGVTSFKEKFGGKRIKFPVAQKIIVKPGFNLIYSLAKKLRR